MMGMYGDIHDKVRDVGEERAKQRVKQLCYESDLRSLDNVIDDFTKEDQWDMQDESTRQVVECFRRIRRHFHRVKEIVEQSQFAT